MHLAYRVHIAICMQHGIKHGHTHTLNVNVKIVLTAIVLETYVEPRNDYIHNAFNIFTTLRILCEIFVRLCERSPAFV